MISNRAWRLRPWWLALPIAALGWGAISAPAPALALTLKPDAPQRYTVREGDTLWTLAARFLEQPWEWPELWERNPHVTTPQQLYPGDVIVLGGDATPNLGVERSRGIVRLSPDVRRAPAREAIPALPLDRIKVFLESYQIAEREILDNAPSVVAGESSRLLSGARDTLYAHGPLPAVGSRLAVYRPDGEYRSPENAESLGFELQRLGHVRVVRTEGEVGELVVLDSLKEIRNGDYLLSLHEGGISTRFQPRAPTQPVVATILSVPDGVRFIGRYDVVALDRGREHGLEPGHVLQVMRQGEQVRDEIRDEWVTLPDTEAGAVMIFRVFERVSYALVMRASQVLEVGDRLVVPRGLRQVLSGAGRE